jgi:signal transduction histidine kinase
VLSHELRTPLTPILGLLGMLKRPSLSEERRRGALETIEQSAHAEARIVSATVESIRPSAAAKDLTLTFEAVPVALPVFADRARLQQVVWNLVVNAVKFTPSGGRIQVTLNAQDRSAIFSVRDTGVGIVPDLIPAIFDRFRQGDASSTRIHGGLGLGLTIVRHIVEEHGGAVTAESPGGGLGASFTVSLPLHGDVPPGAPSSAEASDPKQSARIASG